MKPERTMTDAQGNAVPLRYVKAYDRERDRRVRRCLDRWMRARQMIVRVYRETAVDIEALEALAAAGREDRPLGKKGNFQASTFDGLGQVSRSARYEMRFDERLRTAQEIIEGIIQEKAEGIDSDVAEMIKATFRPTSDGLLSQARVLGLFKLKIKHPQWLVAMDMIRESIDTRRGKNLLGVRFKPSRDAEWVSVLLDIAAVDDAAAVAEAFHAEE